MKKWSLPTLLSGLHDDVETRLAISRRAFSHPGTKGDASENVWLNLLQAYLPKRYQSAKAHVVDSLGRFSQQIDVVVFDRQYSPFIFEYEGQTIIPAESIYAVFEAKQAVNAEMIAYAQTKVASVRGLYRTSVPIPHAGGTYPAKPVQPILGGVVSSDSDWTPPLGPSLLDALNAASPESRLDLGCVARHGTFDCGPAGSYHINARPQAATAFLFELIARLQELATVPMIDIRAYAKWLGIPDESGARAPGS